MSFIPMPRTLAAAVLLALAVRAGAELGPAKRVVPPNLGPIPYSTLDAQSYDGTHFLVTLGTDAGDLYRTRTVLIIDSAGTQVSDPTLIPWNENALGITGNAYVFTFGDWFVRVSAKGELLDEAPRKLPVRSEAAAAGSRRLLVMGSGSLYLVDPDGTAASLGSVSSVSGIAAKGDRFALSYYLGGNYRVRIFDDQGTVLRDAAMPAGTWTVRSDGRSWAFAPRSSSLPWKIVDDDLNTLRSVTTTVPIQPNIGRGYVGAREQYYQFPNPQPPPEALEVSGPTYDVKGAPLPGRTSGFVLRGNARTLLFIDRGAGYPQTAHLVSSLGDLNRPLPPPLAFTGARDREAAVSATNAAGVTLLVWNEATPQSGASIYAARVSAAGTMLDASPVLMGEDCRASRSAVATDGTDFSSCRADAGRSTRTCSSRTVR